MAEGDVLLGLSGALRKGSSNTMLMREAARLYGPARFIEADLRLPLYDGDLEDSEGIPEAVQRLARQIAEADAVIVAAPEYNKSISGVLKNALDWVSRTSPNPWAGKPVAVMSSAAGRSGGERGQMITRLALLPFRPRLLPGPEVFVADGRNQFDADGRLINEQSLKLLATLMEALKAEVDLLRRAA
jgi:chromate reductase